MEKAGLRGKCPICGRSSLKAVSTKYPIFVARSDQPDRVGGLIGYQCAQEGHLFFVMASDVEEEIAQLNSA